VIFQFTAFGFLINVLINAIIGIIQEIRAKKTIEKLKLVTESTSYVVRNDNRISIPSANIVLDDIVEISTGKQIPVDGTIVYGTIEANEALLTGEADVIKKNIGDSVLAGSFVTSGIAFVRADSVGDYTYSAKIQAAAKDLKAVKSKLMTSIYGILKWVSVFMIPISIGLAVKLALGTFDPTSIIVKQVGTTIVGMVPTGMILLSSLSLAMGIVKLGKQNTMVQDLYSIEMLARVDTICFDKTGTLTNGNMEVDKIVYLKHKNEKIIKNIMSSILMALPEKNKTSLALIDKFGIEQTYAALNIIPFSSSRKRTTVSLDDGKTYVLGAPEFITTDKAILNSVNTYANKGYRVLLLESYIGDIQEEIPKTHEDLVFILIKDQIRKEVHATMAWFDNNDVDVKIISGDNAITVAQIAKESGIKHTDKAISLENIPDKEIPRLAKEYYIFGRVTPEQKALLIEAMQKDGKTVAYAGDGVNDILSLKTADCGIAMAGGSDAAKDVANVVLLDSNFANLPSVVNEGRRVIHNITRTSTLFLMKTFSMMLIAMLTIFGV